MPKIAYVKKKVGQDRLTVITQANEIIEDYQAQGFDLTLRQLYYQFIAHDHFSDARWYLWVPEKAKWKNVEAGTPGSTKNTDVNYKWLGEVIGDGRLAGLVDWEAITDRTRNLHKNSHWDDPADIVKSAANSFALDKWEDQPYRVECWIEKDALLGILESACEPLDVPYFSCRGYTSISEVWSAAMRLKRWKTRGQKIVILHLGDHDPSGIDMSRDIPTRLKMFGVKVEFQRLALNMDQVEQYNPPPNPAKVTDSRFKKYQKLHGDESWELDALDPAVLVSLIQDNIANYRDEAAWAETLGREEEDKARLRKAAKHWDELSESLDDYPDVHEEDEDE